MNSKQLALLIAIGALLWTLLNGHTDASNMQQPSAQQCTNPGEKAWSQMKQVQRLAYGLCASWEASR